MIERLTIPAAECRFSTDASSGVITGYAAVFDQVVPGYNEMVRRGAFSRTIAEHRQAGTPVVMLWSHDPSQPIGRWSAVEDGRGLRVEGQVLTDIARGKEAMALVKAGVVTGLSIGFRTRASERGDKGIRIITDAQLEEVSLVTFPAAPGARVTAVRSSEIAAFQNAINQTISELRTK